MASSRSRQRVVVVGAGVMGSAAAWFLARRGHQVTLVEQFGPDHEQGSSHGCSRIFRMAYGEARYARFARSALDHWRRLEAEAQTALLEFTGGVDHGMPQATALVAAGMAAAGVRHREMRAGEAQERWPGMRFEPPVIYQPDAGRLDAVGVLRALRRGAADHGATMLFDTAVLDVRANGARAEVVLADAVLVADAVVLTVGAWLPAMLGRLGGQLPSLLAGPLVGLPPGTDGRAAFTVTQEQVVYLPLREPGAAGAHRWPVFLHHVTVTDDVANKGFGYYGLRTPDRGIKIGEHGTGPQIDPARPRPAPSAQVTAKIGAYAARWLPGVRASAAAADTCLYTSTPDGEFVLRRAGPVVVCSACSGHGFKFAPLIGARAAALACGAADGRGSLER